MNYSFDNFVNRSVSLDIKYYPNLLQTETRSNPIYIIYLNYLFLFKRSVIKLHPAAHLPDVWSDANY